MIRHQRLHTISSYACAIVVFASVLVGGNFAINTLAGLVHLWDVTRIALALVVGIGCGALSVGAYHGYWELLYRHRVRQFNRVYEEHLAYYQQLGRALRELRERREQPDHEEND
jgi:hypothetical protein